MYKIYKTEDGRLNAKTGFEEDIWIHMVAPTMDESEEVAKKFGIEQNDIRAPLDVEESSRVALEEGYTLILADIPTEEVRNKRMAYTTIPLGILLVKNAVITVCSEDNIVFLPFMSNMVKGGFSTKKKMRFIYQILLRASAVYQIYLRAIDKRRTAIEEGAGNRKTEEADLFELHELESNLVYFATSLNANKVVLERLSRYERIKQYPEDRELLDDVIVENFQAIEMTKIYRDIVHGSRELISTIINNRLNDIMKYLTAITLVMAIPTIVSGFFGMNVDERWMPFSGTPYGFLIIGGITMVICAISLFVLKKKKLL